MNKVILLVLLMPAMAFGQITQNFENGTTSGWIQSPEGRWNTDNLNSISGVFSLHHSYDNSESGTDRTGLALKNLHPGDGVTRWSFAIRYGYEPSSSNNWSVFLMSDSDPGALLTNSRVNGFVVGVNQTGYDDTLRLWKVKEGVYTPVVNSGFNWQTDAGLNEAVRINAERSQSGDWKLQVLNLSNVLLDSASGNDPGLFYPGWFVLSYKYTSTRDRLLWLDDVKIEGVFYEDHHPPEITGCEAAGMNSLILSFSEEPSEESMLLQNFLIENGNNKASEIKRLNSMSFLIRFENEFANKTLNRLIINNLCDKINNCRANVVGEFTLVLATPGDIIISEIMADPLPSVTLPGKEYLELTNRTQFPINLKGWFITDGNQRYFFPEQNIDGTIQAIVCSAPDTVLFRSYGQTIGLKSFPALTDGGKILALKDSLGNLIDGVDYSSDWYGDELKAGGGWSLEIIDPEYPFYGDGNWQASLSREGGTPGKLNSVSGNNPDPVFTGIANVFPEDSVTIALKLSETVIDLVKQGEYLEIEGAGIKNLYPVDPLLTEYTITLSEPLTHGKIFTLSAKVEITDFAGNAMERDVYKFGIPERSQVGDLVFNELLFNPFSGESDYIEFYNNSERIIDASQLSLVSVNDETNDTSAVLSLSAENRCILPGEYYVVTNDRKKVLERFLSSDPFKIFEVSSMPSMPDDKGHLILFNRELDKIDEVLYDEGMQYSLLQANEGISLEKVRPGIQSVEESSWHSASEAKGWGTPGIVNSVFSEKQAGADQVIFSSTKVTPDNDGTNDVLIIDLKLAGTGNVVSVTVFDETGSFVKKLSDNLLAGQEASIVWDGTDGSGRIVDNGIYVILISVFDETGKTRRWKKVCAVIR